MEDASFSSLCLMFVARETVLSSGSSVSLEGGKDDPTVNQIYNEGVRILITNNQLLQEGGNYRIQAYRHPSNMKTQFSPSTKYALSTQFSS